MGTFTHMLLALCVALVSAAVVPPLLFSATTAADKQAAMWDAITNDLTSGSFMNPLKTLYWVSQSAYRWGMTSDHGDVKEAGHCKITHGIGMHARAHFEWAPNNYTGLFQQADHCIVRMANAAPPGGVTMTSYGPNMAVKCFRDGNVESGNFQLIYEVDGYAKYPDDGAAAKSCSYFEGALMNHNPNRPDLPLGLKAFVKYFAQTDDRPCMASVNGMALYGQDGGIVKHPNWPFALLFQPNPALNSLPCEFSDVTSQLRRVPSGSTLYKVWAVHDPWMTYPAGSPDLHFLGTLVLDSPFTPSNFGDHELFFRHTFFRAEWILLKALDPQRAADWATWTDPDTEEGAAHQAVEGHSLYEPFLPPF